MQIGSHDVFWHRPLIGCFPPSSELPRIFHDGPRGYLTAYDREAERYLADKPIELWPRMDLRELCMAGIELFEHEPGIRRFTTAYNIRKIVETHELLEGNPCRAPLRSRS